MYEENTAEKDWTMKLLKEVMHQTGMEEEELCRMARQSPDWMDRLQDCFLLASALDLSLHEFFIQFDIDMKRIKCANR